MWRGIAISGLLALVFVFITLFAVKNPDPVAVELFFTKAQAPVWMVVMIALTTGLVIGLALSTLFGIRLLSQRRRLKKSTRRAEAEVANLRALPMQDAD